jgi:carbon-monoxide dehydrogenase medium subunit
VIPEFNLVEPKDLASALAALDELGPAARALAGGTDLLLAMRDKGLPVETLVDISALPELHGIEVLGDGSLSIGAGVTLRQVETSPIVKRGWPVLAEGVSGIGSMQVRNRGTLGGNLCNASPAADSAPPLLVLNASVEIVSAAGSRVVPIESFFLGVGKTVVGRGELLKRVIVPAMKPGMVAAFVAWGPRNAMDIDVASAAVSLVMGDGLTCTEARVALGAVAAMPIRAPLAETVLLGKLGDERIRKAADEALGNACPIDDVRSTSEFRCRLVPVLVRRAIRQAIARYQAALGPAGATGATVQGD